jgi:hypothetical protein
MGRIANLQFVFGGWEAALQLLDPCDFWLAPQWVKQGQSLLVAQSHSIGLAPELVSLGGAFLTDST